MRRPSNRLTEVRLRPGQMLKMPKLHRMLTQARMNGINTVKVPKPHRTLAQARMNGINTDKVPKPENRPAQVEKEHGNGDKMVKPVNTIPRMGTSKIDLLEKLWARAKPEAKKEEELIGCIMRTVHNALGSSASSLLLLDEKSQELYFKFADGPVGQQLKRLHISRQSGIAGWIVRNAKPLMVNDAERNSHFYKMIDKATGFKTRSIIGVPIIIEDKVMGVIEVLNKADGTDFTKRDLRTMLCVASTAAMTIENSRMNESLLNSYRGTVTAMVSLADCKETCGGGHSRRVSEYALTGARELSLSKEEKQDIEYAAILHDIGKLSIPDSILNKTGKLTDNEWEIIRMHPITGYNLLKDIPFLKEASRLILHHHERYDGRGYPQGLEGEAIPLGARLIAVADAFDNMTTAHSYRKPLTRQGAFAELHQYTRSQFCPVAVKSFNSGFVRSRLSKK